ncbi:GNAT family N-acetyltransferase [Streptomyces sp. NPDC018026]|uniref:GNAT family N-acetyltransferase n=1 Tax=Streptomyces sp. NPDC018026 TaxID=3365031 RepID=UPI003792DD8B
MAADLLMLASATGIRHHLELQLATAEAGKDGWAFVAERDGVVVGAALLSRDPAFPGSVITLVSVSEPARRAGVGSALADLLTERLKEETLPAFYRLRDDLTEGRRFAEQYGYTVHSHSVGWGLDLASQHRTLEAAAHEASRSARVRIRQADLPHDIDEVLECAARCLPDLPTEEGDVRQAGDYFPENTILLLAERDEREDEEIERPALGLTALAPEKDGDTWYTLFTGVVTTHRRTGIARALKSDSFLRAHRAGARSVHTHNHDTNDAIIGLNASFDMRPAPGYWDLRRPIPK